MAACTSSVHPPRRADEKAAQSRHPGVAPGRRTPPARSPPPRVEAVCPDACQRRPTCRPANPAATSLLPPCPPFPSLTHRRLHLALAGDRPPPRADTVAARIATSSRRRASVPSSPARLATTAVATAVGRAPSLPGLSVWAAPPWRPRAAVGRVAPFYPLPPPSPPAGGGSALSLRWRRLPPPAAPPPRDSHAGCLSSRGATAGARTPAAAATPGGAARAGTSAGTSTTGVGRRRRWRRRRRPPGVGATPWLATDADAHRRRGPASPGWAGRHPRSRRSCRRRRSRRWRGVGVPHAVAVGGVGRLRLFIRPACGRRLSGGGG